MDEQEPLYEAVKNPSVPAEYILYRNGELMCHLSESDLANMANDLKYPIYMK